MAEFSLEHLTRPATSGDERHPALVLLHGRGADEQDLFGLAAELDDRLFVLSARAPFAFPWGGYMWYDMPPGSAGFPDRSTLNESLRRLTSFLEEIVEEYPIDPSRIFVGGFSQGAATSAALALTHPGRVAGAMVLSGYIPLNADLAFRIDEVEGLPIFEAHGVFDEMIPVTLARQTRHFLEGTPVDLTYREYPVGHWIAPDELDDAKAWLATLME